MLKRTAYEKLLEFKKSNAQRGMLIYGARQVGKTTLVREFGSKEYEYFAEINFLANPYAVESVLSAKDAKDLFLRLSALSNTQMVPGKTLVFLDEVQECKDVLTWLKFLQEDFNYDFILSGSMLGVDLFNVRSYPVGFIEEFEMFPMSFYEFCQACNLPNSLWETVVEAFNEKIRLPEFIHDKVLNLFYKYLLVGGMPQAVNEFVETGALSNVRITHSAILKAYEKDVTKYVDNKIDRAHIKTIYRAVPNQLNKPNKRFKFNKIEDGARFAHMQTAFDWLEYAGIVLPTLRTSDPLYPLNMSADISSFKLFFSDVGLLTSKLIGNVDVDILNGRSNINFGSIFENAAAQELKTSGYDLFYYYSTKFGEVDFVIQNEEGNISLAEIKSGKDYKRHKAMNKLLQTKNYKFEHKYVFTEKNLEIVNDIEYLPIYMISLL